MPKRNPLFGASHVALCTDLSRAADAGAPGEVELIPAGPDITGRDGRRWLFDDAAGTSVIQAFAARNAALPIDWEHASQHRAPNGEAAPAAAWIERIEVRDGALWGTVNWTERGRNQVAAREYRYLSPVFDFEPATGRIVRLVSAGLTNLPNLHLQALNAEGDTMNRSALLAAALAAVLGLKPEATDDEIATGLNAMKKKLDDETVRALNAERSASTPSLERFVPRVDHDAVIARATNAEKALKDRDAADFTAQVKTEIGAALKAGKITPASVEYYTATCSDREGLERFKAFVAGAAVIAPDGEAEKKPAATGTALNAEERAVCQATGISHEEFAKRRDALAAA